MPSPRTTRRTGRRAAVVALAGALGVLLGSVLFLNEPLREWWHIRRLSSSEEAARLEAAAKLGEMRSLRAVPRLLELIRKEDRERASEQRFVTAGVSMETGEGMDVSISIGVSFTPLLHALHAIGPAARPMVERELERLDASRDPWPVRGAQDGGPRALTRNFSLLLEAWDSPELEVGREEYAAPCAAPFTETYLPPGTPFY